MPDDAGRTLAATCTADQQLLEHAMTVRSGGVHTACRTIGPPISFARAEGARYIDYHAAFGPFVLGHTDPTVTTRVRQTIGEVDLFGLVAVQALDNQTCPGLAEWVLKEVLAKRVVTSPAARRRQRTMCRLASGSHAGAPDGS